MDRSELEQLFSDGRLSEAFDALVRAWYETPDVATALYVVTKYERYRDRVQTIPQRVFIARSFTVEPLLPLLRAAAFVNGLELIVRTGEFNAYAAELLDEQSALYCFAPQIVILATNTASVAPQLWAPDDPGETPLRAAEDDAFTHIAGLITAFRNHSDAQLVIHSFDMPPATVLGVYESRAQRSQTACIASLNDRLKELTRGHRGVHMLDYDALTARHGRSVWGDPLKWERYRVATAAGNMRHLVNEWLKFIQPLSGVVAKVAAVDLDNTLWGGIVGEDGFSGIRLSAEMGGQPYRELQRALLALRRRGIVLAICSKNNHADAIEVLDRHPDMLLHSEHFAAMRINWDSKAQNLEALAKRAKRGNRCNRIHRRQSRGTSAGAICVAKRARH